MKLCVLAALGVVLAFATGCGGGSNGSANTEATKSVDQIVADAESAANNANSVHVAGGAVRGRTPLQLNLDLVAGKGGKGHLTVNGLSFDIIRIGEVAYFKGDATFWRHLGSKFAAQLLEGRWLQAPVTRGRLAAVAPLTDIQQLFHAILGSHGKLTRGASATIGGRPAIALVDATHDATLYVAATGKPYPLEVTSAKRGTITFERWDENVTLTPPANAMDISKLPGFR